MNDVSSVKNLNKQVKEFINKDISTRRVIEKTNNLLRSDKDKHTSYIKKRLEQFDNQSFFNKLNIENNRRYNENFLSAYKILKDKTDSVNRKKYGNNFSEFNSKFKEIVDDYNNRGYKISDTSFEKNVFKPSAILLENGQISRIRDATKYKLDKNVDFIHKMNKTTNAILSREGKKVVNMVKLERNDKIEKSENNTEIINPIIVKDNISKLRNYIENTKSTIIKNSEKYKKHNYNSVVDQSSTIKSIDKNILTDFKNNHARDLTLTINSTEAASISTNKTFTIKKKKSEPHYITRLKDKFKKPLKLLTHNIEIVNQTGASRQNMSRKSRLMSMLEQYEKLEMIYNISSNSNEMNEHMIVKYFDNFTEYDTDFSKKKVNPHSVFKSITDIKRITDSFNFAEKNKNFYKIINNDQLNKNMERIEKLDSKISKLDKIFIRSINK